MAERATADRVAADMKPPNYRGAVQRLRTIKPKKDRISGINGEIGGIYDAVEGFKVNKKAGRIFLTLDALEPDERTDIMRSLMGLIDVAEWEKGDLVDEAEGGDGNIVAADFGGRRAATAAGENAAGEDIGIDEAMRDVETMGADEADEGDVVEDHADAEEKPSGRPKRLSPAEARARVTRHFSEGTAPPTSDQPDAAEPYTGDNSDLAGDLDEAAE